MDHKLRNVEELYASAEHLYTTVVCGENGADAMLGELSQAVEILKNNWKGADAGLKIQKVIDVHNELVEVRNALAILARDSSVVACNYRRIQLEHGVTSFGELTPININEKNLLEEHIDVADTIDINPEASLGGDLVYGVSENIDSFIFDAKVTKEDILGNWLVGTGRNSADEAFVNFENNANKNKETLQEVSSDVSRALQNYAF